MFAEIFCDGENVGGLAGMVERLAAHGFRAAATAHVEAMDGVAFFESGLREALRISGGAGSFEAVHENEPRVRILRELGVDQHLNARLCLVELLCDGKSNGVNFARPVIPGDGQEVRVLDDWNKRAQAPILASIRPEGPLLEERREAGRRRCNDVVS